MKTLKEVLTNNNPLLILSYMTKNTSKENISAHIARELDLSAGSVHQILKDFEDKGLIHSRRFGRTIVYDLDKASPLIKAFRVFDNLLDLDPLFTVLKDYSRKIVLFGSCSRGEDNDQSDIDIFIVTDAAEKQKVHDIITEFHSEREIQPIIADTVELMEMERNDPVFYREISKGIEIWEGSYGDR